MKIVIPYQITAYDRIVFICFTATVFNIHGRPKLISIPYIVFEEKRGGILALKRIQIVFGLK